MSGTGAPVPGAPAATAGGRPVVAVAHPVEPNARARYVELLGDRAELAFLAGAAPEARAAALREARALVTFAPARELSDDELAQAAATADFVQCLAAGSDLFPFARFPRFPGRLAIAFNQGAAAGPIAEHAVAMLLAAAKNLPQRHAAMRRGEFPQLQPNTRLAGGTAAIVGFGGIGQAVGRLLAAFGMRLRAVNRSGRVDPASPLAGAVEWCGTIDRLAEAFDGVDAIVLAAELNADTRERVGAAELARAKPDAVLVNVGRAQLLRQAEVYAFLRDRPAFRAGLDVWWIEPLTHGRFETEHPFLELPNVIGSPHNSPIVPGIQRDLADAAGRNVRRWLEGEVPLRLAAVR